MMDCSMSFRRWQTVIAARMERDVRRGASEETATLESAGAGVDTDFQFSG